MAFFKAKVLRQRKDGMYVVYIRVTQNRKSQYIRTSWIVDDMGLSKDRSKSKIGSTYRLSFLALLS